MNPNDYTIRHLDTMRRFATELDALPAAILEHRYFSEVFGSWSTTIRFKGQVFRVAYDGRDGNVALEHSTTKKRPYTWQGPTWTTRLASRDAEMPIPELKAAMADVIKAG